MYTGFNTYLGYEDKSLLEHEFVVLSSKKIDGNFILHHFISQYLKNNARIVLFGFSQILTHYSSACHKLGVNISMARDNNQFVYVDILQLMQDGFLCENPSEDVIFSNLNSSTFSLKKIYKMIQANIPADKPTLVLIDDITTMVNIGVSVQDVCDFIHYCKVLSMQKNASFIISTQHNEDDVEYTAILSQLKSYATLQIHVKALATGYSRDLSGELNIVKHSENPLSARRLHFKLNDKDAKFFSPGMSSAVL